MLRASLTCTLTLTTLDAADVDDDGRPLPKPGGSAAP